MKAEISVRSWCVVMLVLPLPWSLDSALKSNDISAMNVPGDVISHLQGSRSRTADCPVLPPCRCVHSAGQGRRSVVRVACDSPQSGRRRILRFPKTSSRANPSVQRLSLAYAGLNALPAATFRHIKVCDVVYLQSNCH